MVNLKGGDFNKFIVIKKEDVDRYLPRHDIVDLIHIINKIGDCRERQGKGQNTYLVINTDESYTDEVIDILKRNEHWG